LPEREYYVKEFQTEKFTLPMQLKQAFDGLCFDATFENTNICLSCGAGLVLLIIRKEMLGLTLSQRHPHFSSAYSKPSYKRQILKTIRETHRRMIPGWLLFESARRKNP
jgi:hypothetical protein